MKLDFAFLADAATITDDGLFAVVGGGFDVLKPQAFPATKSAMALVGRVTFPADEMGKSYLLHGEIIGPDGCALPPDMSPDMWLSIKPFPHPRNPERGNWTTICLNYQGVSFPTPGVYFVRLSLRTQDAGAGGFQILGQVKIEVLPLGGSS
jgi:hypothetical protein